MLAPIVLCEDRRVTQPKVAGEIDYFHVRWNSRRNLHRLSVRQREKSTILVHETRRILRRSAESQISQTQKVAMDFANGFPRMLVRSDESDLRVRMQQQYAQQFRTAVA